MDQQTGKYILIVGLIIVAAGILIYFFHDYFKWIGRLPGDIRIEKENFRLYFPLTTMIIFSLAITIIIQIFKRFF
jgi:membrane-anchored protein YejM (alkaline phosphatase superfamily)